MKEKQVSAAQFLMGFISTKQGQISKAIKGTAFSDEIRSQQQALLNDGTMSMPSALTSPDILDHCSRAPHPMALPSRSTKPGDGRAMIAVNPPASTTSFRASRTDGADADSIDTRKADEEHIKVDQVLLDRILAQFGVSAATRKKMLDAEDQQHRISLDRVKDILGADSAVNLEVLAHGKVSGNEVRRLLQPMHTGSALSNKGNTGDRSTVRFSIEDNRGFDLKRFEVLLDRIVRDAQHRLQNEAEREGGQEKTFAPLSIPDMNEVATQLVEWVLPDIGKESAAPGVHQAGAMDGKNGRVQKEANATILQAAKNQPASHVSDHHASAAPLVQEHRVTIATADDTVQWLIEPLGKEADARQAVLLQLGLSRSKPQDAMGPSSVPGPLAASTPHLGSVPVVSDASEASDAKVISALAAVDGDRPRRADSSSQPLPYLDGEALGDEISPHLFKDVTVIRISRGSESSKRSDDRQGEKIQTPQGGNRRSASQKKLLESEPEGVVVQERGEAGNRQMLARAAESFDGATETPSGSNEQFISSTEEKVRAGAGLKHQLSPNEKDLAEVHTVHDGSGKDSLSALDFSENRETPADMSVNNRARRTASWQGTSYRDGLGQEEEVVDGTTPDREGGQKLEAYRPFARKPQRSSAVHSFEMGGARFETESSTPMMNSDGESAGGTQAHSDELRMSTVRGVATAAAGLRPEESSMSSSDQMSAQATARIEQARRDGEAVFSEVPSRHDQHRTGSHRPTGSHGEGPAVTRQVEKSETGAQTGGNDSSATPFHESEPDIDSKVTDSRPSQLFNRLVSASPAGPAPARNAMPMEVLSFHSPDWSNRLVNHFKGMRRGDISRLVIRLHPERLGSMVLRLKSEKGKIITRITADNESARQLLLQNASHLQQQMAEQGFTLGEFSVDVGQMTQQGFRQQGEKGHFQAPKVNRRTVLGRQQPMGTDDRVLVYPQRNQELVVNLIA